MTSTLNKNSQSLAFLGQTFTSLSPLYHTPHLSLGFPIQTKTIFYKPCTSAKSNSSESYRFHSIPFGKYTFKEGENTPSMENSADWEVRNLINELKQGRELARQLQVHINAPSAGVGETQEQKQAMAVASMQPSTVITVGMSESPRSRSVSPHSEDSDREFKDPGTGDTSRKRKTMPRWTKQIQVSPGTGLEGSLDDGFSWRKYGQKDILGAKYPRGYYRCTHRLVQGCFATKQVQRSDEDPTILEVTYRGTHTCNQVSGPNHQQQHFPIFNFPSASATEQESGPFSPRLIDNNFAGNMSPAFMSPSTTGSNYFSVSPTHTSAFPSMQNPYLSEPEFTDLISAATSATNSPTIGMDFPFSQTGFDPNFTFDNSGFFP